jgi:hypothetical protein
MGSFWIQDNNVATREASMILTAEELQKLVAMLRQFTGQSSFLVHACLKAALREACNTEQCDKMAMVDTTARRLQILWRAHELVQTHPEYVTLTGHRFDKEDERILLTSAFARECTQLRTDDERWNWLLGQLQLLHGRLCMLQRKLSRLRRLSGQCGI